jgi:hypothetical protein
MSLEKEDFSFKVKGFNYPIKINDLVICATEFGSTFFQRFAQVGCAAYLNRKVNSLRRIFAEMSGAYFRARRNGSRRAIYKLVL